MDKYRKLLNISYQRSISPDYYGFFERFYQNFYAADPCVARLFKKTDMDGQYRMLMQSMTHIITFSTKLESSEEMDNVAMIHGKDKLDIPVELFDIWLECLIDTVRERDLVFNTQTEIAWRVVMAAGIAYMKSFCSHQQILK